MIDFGIAAKQGETASPPLTPSGLEMGTLAYMAPERLNGVASPSNDIYSLGVILYQMLARYLPLGEGLVTNAVPGPLAAVARRCTAAHPEDRYAGVTEVLRAFEQACQALSAPTRVLQYPPALSTQAVEPTEPVYVEYAPGAYIPGKNESLPAPRYEGSETFSKADYAAPTTSVARAYGGSSSHVNASDKRSFAASAVISVDVPESKKPASRKPRSHRSLFAILSLSMAAVGIVMAGVVFLAFPLFASASVNIGPQVHTLQQVYTIAAQPSLSGVDLANTAIPAYTKVATLNGSLSGQTTGQRCVGFFFQCQQVVSPDDVLNVSAQLRQSLSSQLSAQIGSQLQAAGGAAIGSIQFTDLSEVNTPDIGALSDTVSVALQEQGSVEYVNNADVQRLTRLLLAQELGPNTILVNSTLHIGQPVIEGVSDSGAMTMKVPVAGVEEYNYTPAQLEAMQNSIKGMTLADARLYLSQQPGVDANSVSISIHTLIGGSNTLPYNASQIKIISINPTTLPSATLPVIAPPTDTTGSLTPNV